MATKLSTKHSRGRLKARPLGKQERQKNGGRKISWTSLQNERARHLINAAKCHEGRYYLDSVIKKFGIHLFQTLDRMMKAGIVEGVFLKTLSEEELNGQELIPNGKRYYFVDIDAACLQFDLKPRKKGKNTKRKIKKTDPDSNQTHSPISTIATIGDLIEGQAQNKQALIKAILESDDELGIDELAERAAKLANREFHIAAAFEKLEKGFKSFIESHTPVFKDLNELGLNEESDTIRSGMVNLYKVMLCTESFSSELEKLLALAKKYDESSVFRDSEGVVQFCEKLSDLRKFSTADNNK